MSLHSNSAFKNSTRPEIKKKLGTYWVLIFYYSSWDKELISQWETTSYLWWNYAKNDGQWVMWRTGNRYCWQECKLVLMLWEKIKSFSRYRNRVALSLSFSVPECMYVCMCMFVCVYRDPLINNNNKAYKWKFKKIYSTQENMGYR